MTTALGQSPPDPDLIYEAIKTQPGFSGAGPLILALVTGGFDAIAEMHANYLILLALQ